MSPPKNPDFLNLFREFEELYRPASRDRVKATSGFAILKVNTKYKRMTTSEQTTTNCAICMLGDFVEGFCFSAHHYILA